LLAGKARLCKSIAWPAADQKNIASSVSMSLIGPFPVLDSLRRGSITAGRCGMKHAALFVCAAHESRE
jgi:hypothetical protein